MDLSIAHLRLDTRLDTLTKWFFLCLIDLCGVAGSCHLSVRELSQKTGTAIGKIAGKKGMIHTLVETGYIAATKQPRPTGERYPKGHEVWYITIVGLAGIPQQNNGNASTEQQGILYLDNKRITIKIEEGDEKR